VVAVVFVTLDDHEILVQHGGGPGAEPQRRKLLDDLPLERAREVVRVEPFGTEIGEHHVPVRDGRRPGKTAAAMACIEDRPLVGRAIPQDLSRLRIEGEQFERVLQVPGHAVGVNPFLAAERVGDGLLPGNRRALDHRRHEDAIAPDDGRRMAASRQRRLPGDVLVRCPLGRQLGFRRHPLPARTSPLRPVLPPGPDGHRNSRGEDYRRNQYRTNMRHSRAPLRQPRG
jgi:hypothetical protein